jgi:hypothetical protein
LPGRWRAARAYPHPAADARTWVLAGGSLPLVGRLLADTPGGGAGVDPPDPRATAGTDV